MDALRRGHAAPHRTGRTVIATHIDERSGDPHLIALEALAWILADDDRARRFLDLTGLSPEALRGSAAATSTHRAVLEFLCAHEPDLIAAADALALPPEALSAALRNLGR